MSICNKDCFAARMLMGFYKGMLVAREEVRGWLERMVQNAAD